jgi:hypothetical protein
MLPILRALKGRLLNEPAFFLSSAAAVAVVVGDLVAVPIYVSAIVVVLGGIATRAVVTPTH